MNSRQKLYEPVLCRGFILISSRRKQYLDAANAFQRKKNSIIQVLALTGQIS